MKHTVYPARQMWVKNDVCKCWMGWTGRSNTCLLFIFRGGWFPLFEVVMLRSTSLLQAASHLRCICAQCWSSNSLKTGSFVYQIKFHLMFLHIIVHPRILNQFYLYIFNEHGYLKWLSSIHLESSLSFVQGRGAAGVSSCAQRNFNMNSKLWIINPPRKQRRRLLRPIGLTL